jgi:hypothetical protein
MLRELDAKECDATRQHQGTIAGLIKILEVHSKILNPKSKICPSTPTFAVLSQTVESGVSAGELNTPFLHGHF